MKYKWSNESYINKCTRKERMGIVWPKAMIWKIRVIRRGPLCLGKEFAKHILLKCSETKSGGKNV
jgi:hypothetical protein